MNKYLFRKYWGKHKGRLLALILSIILLTATAVFSVLNERTELRRQLHSLLDINGNYAVSVLNVTDEEGSEIEKLPYIEQIGKVSAFGKISNSNKEYTVGYFNNSESEDISHLPLVKGTMPVKSGQIAFPEFLAKQLFSEYNIGDSITISFTTLDGCEKTESFELCGIISDDINRRDMEYFGRDEGRTILQNEIDFPSPSVYLYKDDVSQFEKYTNYLIHQDEKYYFSKDFEKSEDTIAKLWDINNNVISGGEKLVNDALSDMGYTEEGFLQTKQTDEMKVIRIITVLMLIVATISMISGITSIMPQRMESFKLLRSIGMSKKKLVLLFFYEFIIFWIIGTVSGIGLACLIHESLIAFQKSIGISAYRGYIAEYIVEQKTSSPFILPVILSLLIILITLIIPLIRIIKMSFYEKQRVKRFRKKAKSFKTAFSKITGTRLLSHITSISMIVVICATIFGYCYYTQSGKGTSLLSIGNTDTEASYYTVNGIDLKDNKIDCNISVNIPKGNEIAVYNKEYGLSNEEVSDLSKKADVLAWSMYPAFTVVYDENQEVPELLNNCYVPFNEDWEYYDDFKTNSIYDLQLILLNDKMMNMLCSGSSEDVLIISNNDVFPFETGDTIPMISCLCNDTQHVNLDTIKRINTTVTKQLNLSEVDIENNAILKNCGLLSSSNQYSIAMTAEKATKLGFYYPNYDTAFINFNGKLSDEEMRNSISTVTDKPVLITTIQELTEKAKLNKISSNINSWVLFALLFILCMITLINLLNMNIRNNISKFETIHSIGYSFKKIRKIFISNIMTNSVIAFIFSFIALISGKMFIESKYNQFTDLLTEQQKMCGNESYPEVIIWFNPSDIDKTDDMYNITCQLDSLKERFMLDKELWLPNIMTPLLIIGGIIIITTFVCSIISAKKISFERSRKDD